MRHHATLGDTSEDGALLIRLGRCAQVTHLSGMAGLLLGGGDEVCSALSELFLDRPDRNAAPDGTIERIFRVFSCPLDSPQALS